MTEQITIPEVAEENAKTRIDAYITKQTEDLSRARVQKLLADNAVTLNDNIFTNASYKVCIGDKITIKVPPLEVLEAVAEDIPLDILYEDDHLIVVNKPAGLTVHPAAGHAQGTLVNALLFHCKDKLSGINGVERPGIVHRLDKDTSGVMVVAKDDQTHHGLSKQFADHSLERVYTAMCYGVPNPTEDLIDQPVGRHPTNRKKMTVTDRNSKEAQTNYKLVKRFHHDAALITCRLHTGRTHQIRVHMKHIGHPLLGDTVYARYRPLKSYKDDVNQLLKITNRQMLHAGVLGFTHPITKEVLHFESSPPEDFCQLKEMLSNY